MVSVDNYRPPIIDRLKKQQKDKSRIVLGLGLG